MIRWRMCGRANWSERVVYRDHDHELRSLEGEWETWAENGKGRTGSGQAARQSGVGGRILEGEISAEESWR